MSSRQNSHQNDCTSVAARQTHRDSGRTGPFHPPICRVTEALPRAPRPLVNLRTTNLLLSADTRRQPITYVRRMLEISLRFRSPIPLKYRRIVPRTTGPIRVRDATVFILPWLRILERSIGLYRISIF